MAIVCSRCGGMWDAVPNTVHTCKVKDDSVEGYVWCVCRECKRRIYGSKYKAYICQSCGLEMDWEEDMEGVPMHTVIKTGTILMFGGEEFQIVEIQRTDTLEGKGIILRALDPGLADREQQQKMKVSQIGENTIDMLRKLMEGGKGFGGFNIGG